MINYEPDDFSIYRIDYGPPVAIKVNSFITKTEKACQFEVKNGKLLWFPVKQILSFNPETLVLTISGWLYHQKRWEF